MSRFRINAHALPLNLIGLSILLYVMTQGSANQPAAANAFHPGLESGKWAIRFLLISLAMTPLCTYLRWTGAIKLRKPAGLWAFGFAAVHVYFYVEESGLDWLDESMSLYLGLGLYGLVVLTALAATSNRWSMRRLGKHWKRLHRLVYYASLSVAVHAILASSMSKKMFLYDPDAASELKVYLGALIVLLALRIPQIRRLLARWKSPPRKAPAYVMPFAEVGPDKRRPETPPPGRPPLPDKATPEVELWRSPNGSFTWVASTETERELN